MNEIDIECLKREERAALKLKDLYRRYGYDEYKLSGFEDYSLYADNKSFLDGKGVLSFSVGGKMLALRPDVTLSVIKNVNTSAISDPVKLFYDEHVYRKTSGGGDFAELRQIGVEVIGRVDTVTETEVCGLVLKTLLSVTDGRYVIDVSHAGIIEKALNKLGDNGRPVRKKAAEYLMSKNAHDFLRFAAANGINKIYADAFCALITIPCERESAVNSLAPFSEILDIGNELDELNDVLSAVGEHACVNFSIGGDADYYNRVVFKGYVEGVPYAVLSGGRYDKLLGRFGKSAEAIGFALYLGEICNYYNDEPLKPDAVVVYNDRSAKNASIQAERLRDKGMRVRVVGNADGYDCKIFCAEDDI